MVSSIMGRINHYAIYNSDIDVHPSDYPFESASEYVPDTGITQIKSSDDG